MRRPLNVYVNGAVRLGASAFARFKVISSEPNRRSNFHYIEKAGKIKNEAQPNPVESRKDERCLRKGGSLRFLLKNGGEPLQSEQVRSYLMETSLPLRMVSCFWTRVFMPERCPSTLPAETGMRRADSTFGMLTNKMPRSIRASMCSGRISASNSNSRTR